MCVEWVRVIVVDVYVCVVVAVRVFGDMYVGYVSVYACVMYAVDIVVVCQW